MIDKYGDRFVIEVDDHRVIGLRIKLSQKDSSSLKTVPENIFNLIELKKLEIYISDLGVISSKMGKLSGLEFLDISYNDNLKNLPVEIWDLKNLIYLDIEGLALKRLPENVLNLKKLEYL